MCVYVCVVGFANGQAYNFALMAKRAKYQRRKTSNDDESKLPSRSMGNSGTTRGGAMNVCVVCVCVCGAVRDSLAVFRLISFPPQHLPSQTLSKSVEPPFFGLRQKISASGRGGGGFYSFDAAAPPPLHSSSRDRRPRCLPDCAAPTPTERKPPRSIFSHCSSIINDHNNGKLLTSPLAPGRCHVLPGFGSSGQDLVSSHWDSSGLSQPNMSPKQHRSR
jgi:hypothetical protein